MNNQIHFISQYLATAAKSFVAHRADDSHTNLGFDSETRSLETWSLNNNGLKLIFNITEFELKWSKGESFQLAGKTHTQVVHWLQTSSKLAGLNKPYAFDLHYDLPFEWDANFSFKLSDTKHLNELVELRILANTALKAFLKMENLQSDIRIWPHHFDTGAFVVLEDGSGKSIGLGMAIPDTVVDDHYFYISGYKGHDALDTHSFPKLSSGEWKTQEFKGAVLMASNSTEQQAVQFLQEAFHTYLK